MQDNIVRYIWSDVPAIRSTPDILQGLSSLLLRLVIYNQAAVQNCELWRADFCTASSTCAFESAPITLVHFWWKMFLTRQTRKGAIAGCGHRTGQATIAWSQQHDIDSSKLHRQQNSLVQVCRAGQASYSKLSDILPNRIKSCRAMSHKK